MPWIPAVWGCGDVNDGSNNNNKVGGDENDEEDDAADGTNNFAIVAAKRAKKEGSRSGSTAAGRGVTNFWTQCSQRRPRSRRK